MMMQDSDEKYMRLALELAEKGRGKVEPNPMVGAVLVKHDRIVGTGYHRDFGGPHAEIHAIKEGGNACEGSTLYVSLEPCAHYGKTAPCAEAIIEAGIKRVITTTLDPNPATYGKGIKRLIQAGIEVRMGVMETQAKKLNAPFFKLIQKGLPYVIIKWAMSLDGKIATATGESKWITNEESRQYVHKLRGQVDGILVGINTVLNDDPLLTCRLKDGRNPRRIIIDSNAAIPLKSRLLKTIHQSELIIAVSNSASQTNIERLQERGCVVIKTKNKDNQVDMKELFLKLGSMKLTNILVEGGSRIITTVLEERLADKIMVFIAPIIIGGSGDKSPILGEGVVAIDDAIKIHDIAERRLLDDIIIEGIVNYY